MLPSASDGRREKGTRANALPRCRAGRCALWLPPRAANTVQTHRFARHRVDSPPSLARHCPTETYPAVLQVSVLDATHVVVGPNTVAQTQGQNNAEDECGFVNKRLNRMCQRYFDGTLDPLSEIGAISSPKCRLAFSGHLDRKAAGIDGSANIRLSIEDHRA